MHHSSVQAPGPASDQSLFGKYSHLDPLQLAFCSFLTFFFVLLVIPSYFTSFLLAVRLALHRQGNPGRGPDLVGEA